MSNSTQSTRWLIGLAVSSLLALPGAAQNGSHDTSSTATQQAPAAPGQHDAEPPEGPDFESEPRGGGPDEGFERGERPAGGFGEAEPEEAVVTPRPSARAAARNVSITMPATSTPPDPASELRFNFEGVPLDTVLNYMSQAAGFIIVRSVDIDGRVNVVSQQPLNADQAVQLLDTVLNEKGFAAIRNDRTLTIVTREEAKRREIPVIKGNDPAGIPRNDKMVTQIIPVSYVNAKQLVSDLAALIPEDASMTANESSNTIILTDTQSSVRRITEIIEGLDSSISEISQLRVFALRFADAKAAAELVKTLFATPASGQTQEDPRRQFMQRFGGGRGGGFGGGGGGGGDQNQNQNQNQQSAALQASTKVTAAADERTNSLIVSAPDQQMVLIEQLVYSIDTSTDALTEVRVFPLRYSDATQTAELVKGIFAPQTSTQQTQGQGGGGGRRFAQMMAQMQQQQTQAAQSERQKSETTVLAVPDTRTNSVIVSASEASMDQIASMIEQLEKNPAKNKRVFVHTLKNANPEDVAIVLEEMFGTNSTGGSSVSRSSSSSSRNTGSSQNSNSNSTRRNNSNSNSSSRSTSSR